MVFSYSDTSMPSMPRIVRQESSVHGRSFDWANYKISLSSSSQNKIYIYISALFWAHIGQTTKIVYAIERQFREGQFYVPCPSHLTGWKRNPICTCFDVQLFLPLLSLQVYSSPGWRNQVLAVGNGSSKLLLNLLGVIYLCR